VHARPPIAISLLIACNACAEDCPKTVETAVADAHGEPTCEHIEPRNDREVVLCNDLGEGIIANVAFPPEAPPPGGWPGVVVLHGSGGLHDSGPDDEDPCRETVQAQFASWAAALNQRGYAVIMPASFYSRGFCEWNDGTRPDDMDDHERLILRTFDAAAAVDWMCEDPRVDCSRLALLGFSNGGSVALMLMHEGLPYTKDARLHAIDNLPPLVGAAAYYPGCGLEDELVNDLTETDIGRFYWPTAPIWVPHAEKDSLLDDCEEVRDPQVDMIAEKRGVEFDMFELEIYDNAKHGFDATSSDGRKADYHASVDAQAKTLERFEEWFK
jgi:dienelactone hydrolase